MIKDRKIDLMDRKILDTLATEGRLPVTELARRVGLSKSPCQTRLQRLIADKVILGFRAVLSPHLRAKTHITFVEIKLNDTREKALDKFNAAVRAIPEVDECHMIAGSFDYLLKIRSRDIRTYRSLLGEVISALPHVASTSTHVVMEPVKDHLSGG